MHHPKIDRFFAQMEGVVAVARVIHQRLAYEIGSDFNVFRFIRTDEHGLSNIIADLLNPHGPHGQGATFLRLFMQECRLDAEYGLDNARVTTEVSFDKGRMDIEVRFAPNISMVIENKPWALEQDQQMQRYADHLKDKSMLVFLPGFTPKAHSISQDTIEKLKIQHRYATLPYNAPTPSLIHWLHQCEHAAKPQKVRDFLADFAVWIAQKFPEITIDDEDNKK